MVSYLSLTQDGLEEEHFLPHRPDDATGCNAETKIKSEHLNSQVPRASGLCAIQKTANLPAVAAQQLQQRAVGARPYFEGAGVGKD